MPTYTKLTLSGSTNGRGINLTATTFAGRQTIHTATSTAGELDEVWIYVTNNSAATATNLTLIWATQSTDTTADQLKMSIPASTGLYLLVPGFVLGSGLTITAYAGVTANLTIHGWVNRIT